MRSPCRVHLRLKQLSRLLVHVNCCWPKRTSRSATSHSAIRVVVVVVETVVVVDAVVVVDVVRSGMQY